MLYYNYPFGCLPHVSTCASAAGDEQPCHIQSCDVLGAPCFAGQALSQTSWQEREDVGLRGRGAEDVVYRGVLLSQSRCEVFCLKNSSGLGFLTIKCMNE